MSKLSTLIGMGAAMGMPVAKMLDAAIVVEVEKAKRQRLRYKRPLSAYRQPPRSMTEDELKQYKSTKKLVVVTELAKTLK